MRKRCTALVALLCLVACHARAADTSTSMPVGMEGRARAILPEQGLTAVPVIDRSPLYLRVVSCSAAEEGFAYELSYMGNVPGPYNLIDFLVRPDGSRPQAEPVAVKIISVLGEAHRGELAAAPTLAPPLLGGYRQVLIAIAVLWCLPFVWMFVRFCHRRFQPVLPAPLPPSLIDRMQPLLQRIARDSASDAERAQLERLLLAVWRERWPDASLTEAIARMKEDEEIAPILKLLSCWLHSPRPPASDPVKQMLSAYRQEAPR